MIKTSILLPTYLVKDFSIRSLKNTLKPQNPLTFNHSGCKIDKEKFLKGTKMPITNSFLLLKGNYFCVFLLWTQK